MQLQSKHRSLRLLPLLQIQLQHKLHKQRLGHIQSSVRSLRQSEAEAHSRLKQAAREQRRKENEERIQRENQQIHEQLRRIYTRDVLEGEGGGVGYSRVEGNQDRRRLRTEPRREILEENLRMHQRIVAAKSQLAKGRMDEHYSQHRQAQKRMQGNSPRRQQDLRDLLKRKFKIQSSVVLPKVAPQRQRPYMQQVLASRI